MKKSLLGLALAFTITSASATFVQDNGYIIIDDFNTGAVTTSVTGVGNDNTSIAATVFGGTRSINTDGFGLNTTIAETQIPPGVFRFLNDGSTQGQTVISYNNALGMDLEAGRVSSFFDFEVVSVDQNIIFDLTVTDINGNSDIASFTGTVGNLFVNFSSFASVDFTSVTDISLQVTTTANSADFILDSFNVSGFTRVFDANAAPIPTSLPLLGLGLIAFGFSRRKVNK